MANDNKNYFCSQSGTVLFLEEGLLIGASVGILPVILFSDAIGRRKTVFYSLIMSCVGILVTLLFSIVELQFIGLVLWGAGADIAFAVAASSITELVSEEERAKSYTWFAFAFSTGSVANAILFYFVSNYKYVTYIYYGLGFLICTIAFYVYVESPPI